MMVEVEVEWYTGATAGDDRDKAINGEQVVSLVEVSHVVVVLNRNS
jgi:hypothetical protein